MCIEVVMCGRFTLITPLSILRKIFSIETATCDIEASYNIAPTQEVTGVIFQENKSLVKFRWGLVPSWSRDSSGKSKRINARAETVSKKPSFRKAFKKKRCLILADGFYEWKNVKGSKQPFYLTLPSGKPFAFAGLYETWKSSEGSSYDSCCIITTEASDSVCEIHYRMPVILEPGVLETWLNPEIQDTDQLEEVLKAGYVKDLKSYPVSRLVNSPANNNPACIEPLTQAEAT
jgi:putative SOS response-associated peptidase YedK